MITRALGLILLLVFGQAGLAQTVEVRSGDHADFTRLVLNLPDRLEWKTERHKNGASVIFPKSNLTFDTSKVFRRITHERLEHMSAPPGAGRLDLAFTCNCAIRAFWNDRKMLVIDIVDTPPKAPRAAHAEPPSTKPPQSIGSTLPMKPQTISTAAAMMTTQSNSDLGGPDGNLNGSTPLASDETRHIVPDTSLPRMQAELLENLARAASQGLLTPKRVARSHRPNTPGAQRNAPKAQPKETADANVVKETSQSLSANLNLHAQSSIDRDIQGYIEGNISLSGHSACIADNFIDLPTWGNDAPFHTQVGALNGRLLGEFDKPDAAVTLNLAKLYAYFGFGHEAQQVLGLIKLDTPEGDIIAEMAVILDEGHAPRESLFSGQLGCDSAAALWSALSYKALPQDTAIDLNAIQRGFAALPRHLRLHLGPLLSGKLVRAGHEDSAGQILRIIDRAQTNKAPTASMAHADLAQAEGETKEAEAALETVVESNSQPSADAVLKLINQRLDAKQDISFDLAQLAGAYAQENRGAELGQALAKAYLSALAASGAFKQSYREFDRLLPDLNPDSHQLVRETLVRFLTETADDLDFLRFTFAGRAGEPEKLEPEVGSAIAKRLLKNGFETAALHFVSPPTTGPGEREQRLIRAEIALVQNHPRQAEIELIGIEGPDADELRALALTQAGEHHAASGYFMASNQPDAAQDSAWMAGDWDQVGASDDTVMQDVARLMQEDNSDPDSQITGVLAQNRKLLEQSVRARKTLADLLDAKPGPQGPEG